jgi:HEAT repeat protein
MAAVVAVILATSGGQDAGITNQSASDQALVDTSSSSSESRPTENDTLRDSPDSNNDQISFNAIEKKTADLQDDATATRIEQEELSRLPKAEGKIASLIKSLHDTDRQVAFDAAMALGEIGTDAVSAIPDLVDLATFDEQGSYRVHPSLAAGEAIHKINPKAAIPYLVESLEQPEKRYWAARILGEMGPTATASVPSLVRALREVVFSQTDDERSGCAQAAVALAEIRPRGLSALIREMTHENREVRNLAVWATPRGPGGKPAVNALALRLTDEDVEIRRMAAIALGDIGPDAADAIPHIEFALKRERDGMVVFDLQRALQAINASNGNKQ